MRIDIAGVQLTNKTGAFLLCSLALLGVWALPRFASNDLQEGQHVEHNLLNSAISPLVGTSSSKLAPSQASTRAAMLQGWGGITFSEVVGSNVVQRLNQSGHNTIRVSFGTATGFPCLDGDLGSWDPNLFTQVLQTAQAYKMTVVLDYHGYNNPNDPTFQPCWLGFWSGVLSNNWGYSKIVWEPINEPAGSVSILSSAYQAWITQARNLADTHWIAIENTISNGACSFDPRSIANCYPMITDPLNETFLSIHPYLFYDIWLGDGYGSCNPSPANTWGNSTAECVANIYNQGMLQASTAYHIPILDTEGGAVYYSCNNVCGASPPDAVGTDDASYSNTTLHFIQYLTDQMQSENMGWLWWEAGEGSCCGALDTWGNLLSFQPAAPRNGPALNNPSGSPPFSSPIAWLAVSGIAGLAVVVAVVMYRKKSL